MNHLHDEIHVGDSIEVGPPCGEFTIDPSAINGRPIVFLAAGIGITPLLSMAKSLTHAKVSTPLHFIQAVRNSRVHALIGEVRELTENAANVETRVIYDEPLADDLSTGRCDAMGMLTRELLREWTPVDEAEFYVCGPAPFMASVFSHLRELGVDEGRIRHEFFGPQQALEV